MDGPAETLGTVLDRTRLFGGKDALIFPDIRITFDTLHERAMAWAKGLVALNVQAGDHVGLLLPTCPDFIDLLLAITAVGAVAVPLNPRYQAGELAYVIANADLTALITTDEISDAVNFIERITQALPGLATASKPDDLTLAEAPRLRHLVLTEGSARGAFLSASMVLQRGQDVALQAVRTRQNSIRSQDNAIILYTSGTTANPKGCLVSHRAILSNGNSLVRRYQVDAQDRLWSPRPIFHIGGIIPMMIALLAGVPLCTMRKFDGAIALDLLERERATCAFPYFVTILQDIIGAPRFAQADLSHIRLMVANMAVQPAAVREALARKMPNMKPIGNYGLTEGVGPVCASRLDDPHELRTTRLGAPLDGFELEIRNVATGAVCGPDEQGEIVFRGPGTISGYYKAPEKTAETIDSQGWLYSGDIGSLDIHGHIMFHSRLKDMLKVGGENVAAAEIEAVLNSHPAVKLAQVVGVSHPRYQEVPVAFVEINPGAVATERDLIDFCKNKIANFKIPKHISFIREWPMSTSKIQKFKLREMVSHLTFQQ